MHFYLEEIEKRKHLNAFLTVYAEEALVKAKELDHKRKSSGDIGKLHGVVIGLKDVIAYKDHPLTAASKILEGYNSPYNSTVVQRLLDEEAILIGHLNCDEFAMGSTNENSAYGNVLNPIDESRVPGGSSGGSAAAVAAGLCMVALGTDTGGSVRQPASFCGIVGFKPGYGTISRYGIVAYASSFDQVGVLGNTVEDVTLVSSILAGEDEFDSTVERQNPLPASVSSSSKKFRFTYFKEAIDHPSLDKGIRNSFYDFFKKIKNDGHTVEPTSFEYLEYVVPAYYILTTAEASSNLSRYDGIRYGHKTTDFDSLTTFYKNSRSEGFGTEVKRRILLGTFVLSAGYYDAYFQKAQNVRKKLLEKTKLIFSDFDAVILPVSPTLPFKFGEKMDDPVSMYLADIYTVYANLTGLPAISLPLFENEGLPHGLQIMTNRFCELSLLELANQLMHQYQSFHIEGRTTRKNHSIS